VTTTLTTTTTGDSLAARSRTLRSTRATQVLEIVPVASSTAAKYSNRSGLQRTAPDSTGASLA